MESAALRVLAARQKAKGKSQKAKVTPLFRTFAFCLLPFAFCLVFSAHAQRPGGALTIAAGAEPKTLNPLVAADQPSRDAIYPLSADLVHLNRGTLASEPALAAAIASAIAEKWATCQSPI